MPAPKYGNLQPPCKDCERCGCGPYHSQCEKYKEYKERHREYSNLRRKPESVLHYYEKYVNKPSKNKRKGKYTMKPTTGYR